MPGFCVAGSEVALSGWRVGGSEVALSGRRDGGSEVALAGFSICDGADPAFDGRSGFFGAGGGVRRLTAAPLSTGCSGAAFLS